MTVLSVNNVSYISDSNLLEIILLNILNVYTPSMYHGSMGRCIVGV